MKGFGPVVTGTLDSGRVRPEDRLLLLPEGREVRVRRVEVHGEERAVAEAGERTSLNLAGVETARPGARDVPRRAGEPRARDAPDGRGRAALAGLDGPLEDGLAVRFHAGTADVAARLHLLGERGRAPRPRSRPESAPSRSSPAASRSPRAAATASSCGARRRRRRSGAAASSTRGGPASGAARRSGRRRPRSSAATTTGPSPRSSSRRPGPRASTSPPSRAASACTRRPRPRTSTPSRPTGAALRLAPHARRRRLGARSRWRGGPTRSSPSGGRRASRRSSSAGASSSGRSPASSPRRRRRRWLATLAAAKRLVVSGDQAGRPGAAASGVADEAGGFAQRIEEAWREAGFDAPGNLDLAKALGTKPQVVAGLVQHLLKSGALVRLSPEVVVHRPSCRVEPKVAAQKGRTMSVGDFRDLLGLSRKYFIPLLEHLDRRRLTRRVGDARVVE